VTAPDGGAVYGALAGLAAILGVFVTARRGPTADHAHHETAVPPLPPAPMQPEGTWQVSPEMYRWFQDQMTEFHERVGELEDREREQRTRGDRLERLFGLALDHIAAQDHQMHEAGIATVPMAPELAAARETRH
jgi:hypothetical protein